MIFHIFFCMFTGGYSRANNWARGQTLHSSRIAASVEIGLNIPLLGSKTVSQKLQGIGVNVGVKTRVIFPPLFSTKPLSQSWLPGQMHWNSLMSWSTLTRPRRTPTVPRFWEPSQWMFDFPGLPRNQSNGTWCSWWRQSCSTKMYERY